MHAVRIIVLVHFRKTRYCLSVREDEVKGVLCTLYIVHRTLYLYIDFLPLIALRELCQYRVLTRRSDFQLICQIRLPEHAEAEEKK